MKGEGTVAVAGGARRCKRRGFRGLGGCKPGSCAEPAPVESSLNDIPVCSRTFQVLCGYLSDTHTQRGQCSYTEPCMSSGYCFSAAPSFFFFFF